jgi:hypothetical protein
MLLILKIARNDNHACYRKKYKINCVMKCSSGMEKNMCSLALTLQDCNDIVHLRYLT